MKMNSSQEPWTELDHTPLPLIWKDGTAGPILEVMTHCTVVYTYDPREQPVTP